MDENILEIKPLDEQNVSEHIKQEKEDAKENGAEEKPQMSHQDAMAIFRKKLAQIIEEDPLVCDLPPEVTLEELNSEIALEYGQAMTVNVRKANEEVLPVVVVQNATCLDLKKAMQRHIVLQQTRLGGPKIISWSYVWRSNWLVFNGQKLTQDNKPLKEYGIRNRDEVTFLKRLQKK